MIVGYCRISIFEPNNRLAAQKRQLLAMGAQMIFSERVATFGQAVELERALAFAQKGDVVVITRPYRVANSTRGILKLIERLGRNGVGFRVLNTPVDTSTTTGRMILGSAPRWSLGISPLRCLLWDLSIDWWRTR
jgi:DNA invertase Pin-like site-specific DNA recombinase